MKRLIDGVAPNENTSTQFIIEPLAHEDLVVTLCASAYATFWPVPTQSFARTLIPGKVFWPNRLSSIPMPVDQVNSSPSSK